MTDRPAPYGPLETHEPGCYLHEGGDFCDCENSDESAEGDRPAAPERDRWDEQAERELPCDAKSQSKYACEQDDHDPDCSARLRSTYAAGLRKAYSDGVSDGRWTPRRVRSAPTTRHTARPSHDRGTNRRELDK